MSAQTHVFKKHCVSCGYDVSGLVMCPECGTPKQPYRADRAGAELDRYMHHLRTYCVHVQRAVIGVFTALVGYAMWGYAGTQSQITFGITAIGALVTFASCTIVLRESMHLDMSRSYMWGGNAMCMIGVVVFVLCFARYPIKIDDVLYDNKGGFLIQMIVSATMILIGFWMLAETGKMQLYMLSNEARFQRVRKQVTFVRVVALSSIVPVLGWLLVFAPGSPTVCMVSVMTFVIMRSVRAEAKSLTGTTTGTPTSQ